MPLSCSSACANDLDKDICLNVCSLLCCFKYSGYRKVCIFRASGRLTAPGRPEAAGFHSLLGSVDFWFVVGLFVRLGFSCLVIAGDMNGDGYGFLCCCLCILVLSAGYLGVIARYGSRSLWRASPYARKKTRSNPCGRLPLTRWLLYSIVDVFGLSFSGFGFWVLGLL